MKKINIKTARANQKNHSTEMVFILDRSGSMAGLESDTCLLYTSPSPRDRG